MRFPLFQWFAGRTAPAALAALALALGGPAAESAFAQQIPSIEDVAARVSDPESRTDALYTLLAAADMVRRMQNGDEINAGLLQENLDWLGKLRNRHGQTSTRSPVLDPAAWLIHLELVQRELNFDALISPLGPEFNVYLDQIFDRTDERLASALLPEVLWQTEPMGSLIWNDLVEVMDSDEVLKSTLTESNTEWFDAWSGHETAVEHPSASKLFPDVMESLDVIARLVISAGPPDRARLHRIRYLLLAAMPGLDRAGRLEAYSILRLTALLNGLHERRHFSFAEGLVALAAGMISQSKADPDWQSVLPVWLVENLPLISAKYARSFAEVDPHLNSALAAVFDVVSDISRPGEAAQDDIVLRGQLANAVAQLALLIPDLDFYFDLPVRDSIAGGMDACTGIMARREEKTGARR